ncbi:hypothetical protein [Endozoicomonas sp.]|uniref:hypothetical protein n=1 Tax=Endozoicomonas sp. TaxID=1892382 RepID=UPI003AFA00AB
MSGVPIVAVKIEHYCFNHSERAPKPLPETDVGINFSGLLDKQLFEPVCSFQELFKKGNDFHIHKEFIFAGFKLDANGFHELSQSEREQQQRDIIACFVTNSVHGKSKFQAQGYSKIWNNVTAYDEFFKNTGMRHMQNGSEAYLCFLLNEFRNEQDDGFSPLRWLKEVLLINSHLHEHEADNLARLMILWVECTHLMAFQNLKIQPSVFDWEILSRTLSTQDISEFGPSGFTSILDYEMPLQRPKRKRGSEKVTYYPELL